MTDYEKRGCRILVSVPDERAIRFENFSLSKNTSTIGVQEFEPTYIFNSNDLTVLEFLKILRNLIWKVKILADVYQRHLCGKGFVHSLDAKNKKIMAILLSPLYQFLDISLIFFFKSKEVDAVVNNYDEVVIYTMYWISEAFLYSSAKRLNKKVVYRPDAIDAYYAFWLPKKCDYYESWGELFNALIVSQGLKGRARLVGYPLAFNLNQQSHSTIVVYGGSFGKISNDFHMKVLSTIKRYADKKKYRVILKLPPNYNLDLILIESMGITCIEYAPLRLYGDYQHALSLLIRDACLLVCFGPSHGILEFGANSIPSIIFSPNLYSKLKFNSPFMKELINVGILNIDEPFGDDLDEVLNLAIESRYSIFSQLKSIVDVTESNFIKHDN